MNSYSRTVSEKITEAAPVTSLSDMRGSDIEAAHCICCPNCTTKYSPQLHISCYELRSPRMPLSTDAFSPMSTRLTSVAEWTPSPSSNLISPRSLVPESTELSPMVPLSSHNKKHDTKVDPGSCEKELKVIWRESVCHLSPKGLRLALEEQMEGIGERVADPCWLHVHRPAVYWNILWFSSRLKVPTGFLASPLRSDQRVSLQFEKGTSSGIRTSVDADNSCASGSNDLNININNGANINVIGTGTSGNLNGNCPNNKNPNGVFGDSAAPPLMWHLPTVIGWREDIVRIKVRRCLSKSVPQKALARSKSVSSFAPDMSGVETGAFELGDLFPGCDDVSNEGLLGMHGDSTKQTLTKSASLSSSSLSPILYRSSSSPVLITMMRNRSSSTGTTMIPTAVVDTQFRSQSQTHVLTPSSLMSPLSQSGSSCTSSSFNTPLSTSKSTSPLLAPSMRLDRATEYLDGTSEGMRRAILEMGKYRLQIIETRRILQYLANESLQSEKNKSDSNDDESKVNEGIDEITKSIDDNDLRGMKSPRLNDHHSNIFNDGSGIEGLRSPEESFSKRNPEHHVDPHNISRGIYIDLLTLFYMQKCKCSPESGGRDSIMRKTDLFKVSMPFPLFASVCLCVGCVCVWGCVSVCVCVCVCVCVSACVFVCLIICSRFSFIFFLIIICLNVLIKFICLSPNLLIYFIN